MNVKANIVQTLFHLNIQFKFIEMTIYCNKYIEEGKKDKRHKKCRI